MAAREECREIDGIEGEGSRVDTCMLIYNFPLKYALSLRILPNKSECFCPLGTLLDSLPHVKSLVFQNKYPKSLKPRNVVAVPLFFSAVRIIKLNSFGCEN